MSNFIHLHNHTHYSLQDGACTVDGLINAAVKFDMSAVALTDHGVLYGVPEFYSKAKSAGIKPIIGMEAYIVREGNRTVKKQYDEIPGKGRQKHYQHLILIAKNKIGYKNLIKLSSIGFIEGFYYKPRIDLEILEKYSEGLICSSACIGGIIAPYLIENNYKKAKEIASTYKEIFKDDFYLEIQNHGLEKEKAMLEGIPKLSQELGIKLIATNDCHYINKEDAVAHNVLMLMSDKSGEKDYKKLRYKTDQIYFKSPEEMNSLFKDFPEAIENTLEVTSKINFALDFEGYYFPEFKIPENVKAKNQAEYLQLLAEEKLNQKYDKITHEIRERFDYEIKTIIEMGFPSYFLVVQDFINAAKERKIPVGPGRGSVAGSLVAYVLGITTIDPLKYNLLFERFLNPQRASMPDIDVDFADDQRGEVIEYVKCKYGEDCVSQIITFNKLSSKAVIKGVARVLNIPLSTVDKINKNIRSKFGKVQSVSEALENPELRWLKESKDPLMVELINYSKQLEGMNSNYGKHAAGVVIAPKDLSEFVPLSKDVGQTEILTQFNMKELEHFGLLKMDFLGLRTLTIIRDTIKLVKENRNIDIDIEKIPLDDKPAYEIFSKGQTTAVFQFESPPMRVYLSQLKPKSILDLAAMNALYRPGPMDFIPDFLDRKWGKKAIKYLHPLLEDILKETYGIIVYQEQVIQIANKIAGMTLAQADILRRAMGKKDIKAMKKQKDIFIEGAVKNGIDKKVAEEIFDAIDKFANYGFNKSHAVAYSLLAYQTAYLKANFTEEFLASNLTHEFSNISKIGTLLDDCRKMKVAILPPNINKPTVFFTVEKKKIRFGLSGIKNVGVNAVEEIIRAKEKIGRNFKSLYDFCLSVDSRIVNKRTIEGLILAGAFDSINKNRAQLFSSVESALEYASKAANIKHKTENSLFGEMGEEVMLQEPEMPNIEDWSEIEKLTKEKDVIGIYVTDNPVRKYELECVSFSNIQLGEIEETENFNTQLKICGIINDLSIKLDKRMKEMAYFSITDLTGTCECIMFSSAYEIYKNNVKENAIVYLTGKSESNGDRIKIHVNEVVPIDKARDSLTKYVLIDASNKLDDQKIDQILEIYKKYKGEIPIILDASENGGPSKKFVLEKIKIKLTQSFIKEVQKIFGESSIRLVSK